MVVQALPVRVAKQQGFRYQSHPDVVYWGLKPHWEMLLEHLAVGLGSKNAFKKRV